MATVDNHMHYSVVKYILSKIFMLTLMQIWSLDMQQQKKPQREMFYCAAIKWFKYSAFSNTEQEPFRELCKWAASLGFKQVSHFPIQNIVEMHI